MHPFTTLVRTLTAGLLLGLAATTTRAQTPPPAQPPPLAQALEEMRVDVQGRADRAGYPITGMKPDDAREVLSRIHSLDRDDWAAQWSAQGDRYMAQGKAAEPTDRAAARDAYLNAWRLYMFAAWPARTSPGKQAAYAKSTAAFRDFGRMEDPAIEVVRIPFEGKEIVGYLRLPPGIRPAPVVITMGGLDSFKEYASLMFDPGLLGHGMGNFAMDMPGTGESAVPMEIGSERVYSKVLDVLGARPDIDPARIGIYGVSAGGYWATLLGFTERTRLRAAAALGPPIDHYFDADWQHGSWGTKEYLFGLKEARMFVYGTPDEAAFLAKLATFSLRTRGILNQPSTSMLLGNGVKDTQVPVSDVFLALASGTPKYAWLDPEAGHTGMKLGVMLDSVTDRVVAPWLASMMAQAPQPAAR